MGFLKGCYGSSIVFLWDFHWIPMGFLWYLLDSCGISIGFLWDFQGISMMFSMAFLEDLCGNPYGISLGFLCYSMLFL